MNKKLSMAVVGTFCFVILSVAVLPAIGQEVPRMTKEELTGMLGNSNVVIIDVRLGRDWDGSELKIKGAVREDPRNLGSWIGNYPKEKILVFYCA